MGQYGWRTNTNSLAARTDGFCVGFGFKLPAASVRERVGLSRLQQDVLRPKALVVSQRQRRNELRGKRG